MGRRDDLFLGLDGARTGDDLHLVAAEGDAGRDRDEGVLLAPFARDLLVRLADVNDLGDARQRLDARAVDAAVVADEPDRDARLPRHRPGGVAHLLDRLHDAVDLLLRRVVLHHDQHYSSSKSKYQPSRASVTGPAKRAPTSARMSTC